MISIGKVFARVCEGADGGKGDEGRKTERGM